MFVVIRCVIRARNVNITEFRTGYFSFFYTASILYKAAAPAAWAAIKTKLSHRNDKIIAIFFAANKNKGNANAALASSNS